MVSADIESYPILKKRPRDWSIGLARKQSRSLQEVKIYPCEHKFCTNLTFTTSLRVIEYAVTILDAPPLIAGHLKSILASLPSVVV